MYSTSQAAEFLGISRESLVKAERRGWLKCEWAASAHGQPVREFAESELIQYRERQRAKLQARLATMSGAA